MRFGWVLIATIALVLAFSTVFPFKIIGGCGPPWFPSFVVGSVGAAVLAVFALVGSIGTALGGSPKSTPSLWAVSAGVLSLFIVLMPAVPLVPEYLGLCR